MFSPVTVIELKDLSQFYLKLVMHLNDRLKQIGNMQVNFKLLRKVINLHLEAVSNVNTCG